MFVPQAGELAKFDHLGGDWVFDREPVERGVEGEELVVWFGRRHVNQASAPPAATPFSRGVASGVFDQNLVHGAGRRGEEVSVAVPPDYPGRWPRACR